MRNALLTVLLFLSTASIVQAQQYSGYLLTLGSRPSGCTDCGKVLLIQQCKGQYGDILNVIDSTTIDSMGNFSMRYQAPAFGCHHILRAAYNTNYAEYANTIPCYYAGIGSGVIHWDEASYADTPGQYDFVIREGLRNLGPGAIGGKALLGYKKTTAISDPLNMKSMLLTTTQGLVVAYTETAENGTFTFGNLNYGTYLVYGDAWGLKNPPMSVTLTPQAFLYFNLLFQQKLDRFEGQFIWGTTVNNTILSADDVSVYPNPAKDNIYVKGLSKVLGEKHVVLTSVTGQVLYQQQYASGAEVMVPVSTLSTGVYLLRIETNEGAVAIKISKE